LDGRVVAGGGRNPRFTAEQLSSGHDGLRNPKAIDSGGGQKVVAVPEDQVKSDF
jgi:hypothetical protein